MMTVVFIFVKLQYRTEVMALIYIFRVIIYTTLPGLYCVIFMIPWKWHNKMVIF